MKNHRSIAWRYAAGISLAAALLAVPFAASFATPAMDGEKDAEYTSVATSAKDNLLTTGIDVNSNPYNDETNPVAKALDVTGLWAANTASDLYVYVEMPYLDLNVISGEFAIVFHLGGANDSIQMTGTIQDPYGATCYYEETPAVNAVLKSNMAGFKHGQTAPVGFDGNQGYSFLNATTSGLNGWNWANGQFLTNQSWTDDTVNNLIHGVGNTGGEIVYKAGKGMEIKIPLALFASGSSALTVPVMGDSVLMQFYDNVRYYSASNAASEKYPRGPTDCVPYEDGLHTDPLVGHVTQWATAYTLKTPATLEVSGAGIRDPLDLTHAVVSFTTPVGDGATTAANYAVVDEKTNTAVPVVSAAVEADNNTKVDIELTLPYSTKLRVTVSNVKSTAGMLISAGKNTAEFSVGTPVQFTMKDPYGIVAALGTNPDTSAPYRVSMTGDPIGWRNSRPPAVMPAGKTYGWNEIPLNPVSGQANTYQSPVFIASPGNIGYKYCFPEQIDGGEYAGWNALNPNDRRFFVPISSTVVQFTENAAGSYSGTNYDGGPVTMTFTLIDHDNLAAGRAVYVTGAFNGWSGDASGAKPLAAVAGQPNTYSGSFTTEAGFGSDRLTEFKYILIYDDPANPGTSKTEWDLLNPGGNRWIKIHGTGTPLAQTVESYVGSTSAIRILRVASGLDMSPQFGGYYNDMDLDKSGNITLLDVVKALHS